MIKEKRELNWFGDAVQCTVNIFVVSEKSRYRSYEYSLVSNTWVVLDEALVQLSQLLAWDVAGRVIGGLEVQVVFAISVEFRCCDIHTNDDLVGISGLLDGRLQQLQGWRWGESGSFSTNTPKTNGLYNSLISATLKVVQEQEGH